AFPKAPSQRIYSQRIQSEDPLVVATNFIEAWRRNDFYETWQLLTPATKSKFFQNIAMTYSFKGVLNLKRDEFLLPRALFWGAVELPPNERTYYEMNHGLQFDDVIYAGSKMNVLPFNFGPGYKLYFIR
ncbi:TPA: hypothetical protein ND482_004652, partial [Citrobacter farmeri]|nr:hypothetical protein [Citrobacter farmeri]